MVEMHEFEPLPEFPQVCGARVRDPDMWGSRASTRTMMCGWPRTGPYHVKPEPETPLADFEYTLTLTALRQIKAEAWDEGFEVGEDYMNIRRESNPYRDEAGEGFPRVSQGGSDDALVRNPALALPEGMVETDQQYVTRLEDLLTYFETKYSEAWNYADEAYK